MIKNLKADENNWFLEGTFDSDSLFQGEMSVPFLQMTVQLLKMRKPVLHSISS